MRSTAILLLLSVAASAQQEDPGNTGYVAGFRMDDTPRVVWSLSVREDPGQGTIGLSEPCVCDGIVYVGDDKGFLRALKADTGEKIWKYHHGERIYSAPACDGSRVYVSTPKGVEAIDCRTGQSVWSKPLAGGGEISLWPPRDPGPGKVHTLFVGAADGMMHAYIASNGRRRWRESMMVDVPEDPAGFDGQRARIGSNKARPRGICTDGRIVFQGIFDQSRVVAMRTAGGDTLWSFGAKGWIGAAPTVAGDDVFIGSQDRKLYCVKRESGEKRWEFATRSRVSSAAAVHKQRVFVSSCDGGMYCVNRESGEEVWKFVTEPDKTGRRFIYSEPVLTDDAIYFAAGVGIVYALDTKSGNLKWKMRPLPDSQIYSRVRTDGTRLFLTCRPDWDGKGVSALVVLGPDAKPDAD